MCEFTNYQINDRFVYRIKFLFRWNLIYSKEPLFCNFIFLNLQFTMVFLSLPSLLFGHKLQSFLPVPLNLQEVPKIRYLHVFAIRSYYPC